MIPGLSSAPIAILTPGYLMALAPGARLGPFEIVAPLGSGGMGEVYRAHDTRLQRTVAIKVIAESEQEGTDRSRFERFQQEARAIARINHPGICALHDVGQDGATTFLVMEHVAGETLSDRLAGGALPLSLALRTAAQVADALDHAHRQGVTHRDLKPANIMLTRDGVKILDFGLAKLREDPARPAATTFTATAPQLTEAGTIVGTVPYMSPEQVEGRTVDARSDIFSFGVVLYEMVTGRRPFADDSRVLLMAAIVEREPPAPSTLQSLVPPGLDRLIARCLAKDPEDRWQDARDVAAELRWLSDAGSGAGPSAPAARRRSRRVAVTAVLAGAALAATGAAIGLMLRRSEATVPSFRIVTFRRGAVTAARFAPDGQSIVYSASWQGAPHDVFLGRAGSADARSLQLAQGRILAVSRTGDLAVHFGRQTISPGIGTLARVPLGGGARRDLLESVVDADWIPGTEELAVVRVREGGMSQVEFPIGTTVHESRAVWSLRVSPDGTKVAFFDGPVIFDSLPKAALMVIDRSRQKSTLAHDVTALGLAWAPSGREVWYTATTGRHAPSLYGASLSGRVREIYRAPDWVVLHDISQDGRVLMTRNSVRIAMSCQAAGETFERDLTWLMASVATAMTPDGQSVVFSEVLAEAEKGIPHIFSRRLDGAPAVMLGEGAPVALSPDGRWVLARVSDAWSLLPTGPGSTAALPKGSVAPIGTGGSWIDNARIVFTGRDAGPSARQRVYVQHVPDGLPRAITPEGAALAWMAPTPDGRSVLVSTKAGWLLHPLADGEPRPVSGLAPADQPLQWSRDGRFLYVADRSGGRTSSVNVFRIEPATGRRTLWRALAPSDPVGVDNIQRIVITADAAAYCYSYLRRLGDLYVADGLR